ncbi:uncharacterized protein LOC21397145 isoform X2 [Morus notabilis]|uniref:uncharacterized protein LOC21397145 isoform X2 n=1 Tax=Morus notabilis TaxID=981085 RepID=UPI000CED37DE|nr:uncharacterized protein LOC21397145 isoform X2 [Morus notabilis]
MGDLLQNMDIDKLISYGDDLVRVLKDKRDTNSLTQCCDGTKSLRSSCDADSSEVKNLLQDYENKIEECRQKTEAAKSKVVADEELHLLHKELEEECKRETLLLEELRRTLSMFASVTDIIPDLYDPSKVSGHIVDREERVVKKFEFDPTQMSAFDVCDSIWTMIVQDKV